MVSTKLRQFSSNQYNRRGTVKIDKLIGDLMGPDGLRPFISADKKGFRMVYMLNGMVDSELKNGWERETRQRI
jgi:hypothetical protein